MDGITEVYSPPRVERYGPSYGLPSGQSLDLTTGWDFDVKSNRDAAIRLIQCNRPLLLILSPMCTYFSILQNANKHKVDPVAFKANYNRAVAHLKFSLELCALQRDAGRHYLFEHPAQARSWQETCMREFIAESPDALLGTGNMCQFGMSQVHKDGVRKPVAKLTRWLTNSPRRLEALCIKCTRDHEHCQLQGADRAHQAQIYPNRLCRTIASAFAKELHDRELTGILRLRIQ